MSTCPPWGQITCPAVSLPEANQSFEISKLLDFTRQRSKLPTAITSLCRVARPAGSVNPRSA
jgi:hypothetical protein